MVGNCLKRSELSFWGILIVIFAFLAPLEPFLTSQAGSLLKFYTIGCIGLFGIKILFRGAIRIYEPSQVILLLFFIIMFFSTFWSTHMSRGFDYILAIGLQIILILVTTQTNYSDKEKELILLGYVIGCLILSGFVLVNIDQVLAGSGRVSASTAEGSLDPNNVSAYLIAAVAVLHSYKFEKKLLNAARLLCEIVFILAALMTASRGAFVALLVFIVYNALSQKKLKNTAKNILIIAIIAGIVIWLSGRIFGANNPVDLLINRFTSDSTGSDRLFLWDNAINAIRKKPILGYGMGSSPYVVSSGTLGSHNTYLTIWLEAGIVAIGLLLAFYISCWKHKGARKFDSAVFGMLLVTSVTSFFFDAYNKKIFWLPILLCMISIISQSREARKR